MIRENLKRVREAAGLTHQQVADTLNVTKPFYWQIENGKRRLSYEFAVQIASVFKMKPDEIFLTEELTKTEQTEIQNTC